MNDIQNEVEAPKELTEQKENFWGNLWVIISPFIQSVIVPALKSFWEKNGSEVISVLKTLGTSFIKTLFEKFNSKGDKK